MKVSINVADNLVIVDGTGRVVDCSALAAEGKSAVQWYGSDGEVEFAGHAQPNEPIDDFAPYQIYFEQWKHEDTKANIVPSLDSMGTGKTTNQILGAS